MVPQGMGKRFPIPSSYISRAGIVLDTGVEA